MGQSMQMQLANGVHNRVEVRGFRFNREFDLRFVDCRISSLANVAEFSRHPLQSEHTAARWFACCCVFFSLSMAVKATATVSRLQSMHTTTFDLLLDLHLFPQRTHMSLPKYELIIKLADDLDWGQWWILRLGFGQALYQAPMLILKGGSPKHLCSAAFTCFIV